MNRYQSALFRLLALSATANLSGGLLVWSFQVLIDPLPSGERAIAPVEQLGFVRFASIFVGLSLVTLLGALLARGRFQPVGEWFERSQSGQLQGRPPAAVGRTVLHIPLVSGLITAAIWTALCALTLLSGGGLRDVVGQAVAGTFATTIVTFGSEWMWRPVIPLFFPDGDLRSVGAWRLPVSGRLLLVFLLVGVLPPTLSYVLFLDRSRLIPTVPNPDVVLRNTSVLLAFILFTSLVASGFLVAALAHALLHPLRQLQDAMGRVERNDLTARAPVVTSDELGYLTERFNQMTAGLRQGERVRNLFALYVSPEVALEAARTGAGLKGALVECTVLFSDLRGFTTLTERMEPEALVATMNRYMGTMVSAITQEGGVVTRFGGDSLLVVFGTPLNPQPDHIIRALAAAQSMRQALAAFNREQVQMGEPELDNGIGIATGLVVAGNVGGDERIEYTEMGRAANLAARLEEMTKDLGEPILVSAASVAALGAAAQHELVFLGELPVRGSRRPEQVYALRA